MSPCGWRWLLWLPSQKNYLKFKVVSLTSGNSDYLSSGRGGSVVFGEIAQFSGGKGGERLVVAYRVQKGFLENYCQCGRLQEYCRALWADQENTTKVYRRPPPPLLLPFPTPKPRSLTHTKQIIMIIKKIEIHENNYNMSQNIQPIRIQGRRYIRQYYTQPFHCAPQSTRRNVNVENLILYF